MWASKYWLIHLPDRTSEKKTKKTQRCWTLLKLTFCKTNYRYWLYKSNANWISSPDHMCPWCFSAHSSNRRGYLAPVLYSPGLRHHVLHLHLYSLNWLWQWTQAWLKNTLLLVNTGWETHVLNMGKPGISISHEDGQSHPADPSPQRLFKARHSELHISKRCCHLNKCIEFLVGDKGRCSTKWNIPS